MPTTPKLKVKSKYLTKVPDKPLAGTPKHNFGVKKFGSDKMKAGNSLFSKSTQQLSTAMRKEEEALQECSFKPITNKRYKSKSPVSRYKPPNGYQQSVFRMRLAAEEKSRRKKIHEDLGKLKNASRQGRTTFKPFNLRCNRRIEER